MIVKAKYLGNNQIEILQSAGQSAVTIEAVFTPSQPPLGYTVSIDTKNIVFSENGKTAPKMKGEISYGNLPAKN